MAVRPILFKTEMVRAILDGRKTVTRRVVKPQPPATTHICQNSDCMLGWCFWEDSDIHVFRPPYQPDDILYVRETWKRNMDGYSGIDFGGYIYQADCKTIFKDSYNPWHPSIHMPKEAARIWLRVTDVRVERLQDMDCTDAMKEGIDPRLCINLNHTLIKFQKLWDSTIKKSDLDRYGWNANPWVWVIEFEQCEMPEMEE